MLPDIKVAGKMETMGAPRPLETPSAPDSLESLVSLVETGETEVHESPWLLTVKLYSKVKGKPMVM